MADRPILFSAPMIRALIAGRKTQTRRLLGFDSSKVEEFIKVGTDPDGRSVYEMKDKLGKHMTIPAGKHLVTPHYSPRIAVGDRLYVREAWRTFVSLESIPPRDLWSHDATRGAGVFFEAGGNLTISRGLTFPREYVIDNDRGLSPDAEAALGKLRPAMHLPRWGTRITLIVEGVKIERLQDISEDDAAAEGWPDPEDRAKTGIAEIRDAYPIGWYAWLWNDINGLGAWEANPWVVAYTFRRIIGNIDQIEKEAA